jgi:uncharacterized protein YqhQ
MLNKQAQNKAMKLSIIIILLNNFIFGVFMYLLIPKNNNNGIKITTIG